MKLVTHPPVEAERLERMNTAAGSMAVVNATDEADALRHMPEADAFFGKITPRLLSASSKLRWVQSPTASLEHYVFPELVSHPCVLTNMRGLFSDVIADQVMGYVICFARNLHVYVLRAAAGKWAPVGGEAARVAFTSGPGTINDIDRAHHHLADATLGVVGFGAIGRRLAELLAPFGVNVIATRRSPRGDEPIRVSADSETDALLGRADHVIDILPDNPGTARFFNAARFARMKPTALFYNIGRGTTVDQDALIAALYNRQIAGAFLDVTDPEPLPPDHLLWRVPNCFITPHTGGGHHDEFERIVAHFLQNLDRFERAEPLQDKIA